MQQHAPFPSRDEIARARLAEIADQLDEGTVSSRRADLPRPDLMPPPPQVPVPQYGAPQRDAIAALVDDHVQDVCERIDGLIKQLDAMKQQVLVGSATAKQVLNEHIGICLSVNDETDRISDVIDTLAKKAMRL